ncbi:nucleoside triphosphate pyrophosphohydrolase family protein [Nocardia brasiliensis]|uniref:nucleoside triphosphate pyrophosphohydrolase family protein n=1 Tax=Nocardia brasiliensis TaxID=37326 RepID=UPI001895C1AA|nr:nucleoside triphosphate pyrophosphohydrolase family protein [Nocardia brasiliensis]MBF6127834.1 nucleoside triphosphate pyrophosphohydrolase family protein [Nocardia brasiliensis]
MKFSEYQKQAAMTDQHPNDLTIHLLGLGSEAGSVAAVSKTRLRYGEAFSGWRKQMREELGDVLWYVAAIANNFDLDLDDVAKANLHRTRSRWLPTPGYQLDAEAPVHEQLPRQGTYHFEQHRNADGRWEVTVSMDGHQIGDALTDNALNDDGYRFHDVFHLAYAAILGWSPVTRALLKCKRKSVAEIDEAEDGGRGIVIEEGVAAMAFAYGAVHNHLDGITRLDQQILETIAMMTATLEVGVRSAADWESAIIQGYQMFRELLAHGGGSVEFNADQRTLRFAPPA